MDTLSVVRTAKTPEIKLNMVSGLLEIRGRSIPEDSKKFYSPLLQAMSVFSASSLPVFLATFVLEYYNSSSAKCLYDIMKKLNEIQKSGCRVQVKWIYEDGDEDIEEAGQGFQKMFNFNFEITAVKKKLN